MNRRFVGVHDFGVCISAALIVGVPESLCDTANQADKGARRR